MSVFRRIMLGGGLDIDALPDTQKIYYKATAKVTPKNGSLGVAVIANKWNAATSEGVIVCINNIEKIGEGAFMSCTTLTSITIPGSVTSIDRNAFSYCTSLTGVTIPDSVTSIGLTAFYGCSSLTNVTIPDSVTTIGDSAFLFCGSLTSITIPDSVTEIYQYAFYNCPSLISVYCKATTPPSLGYQTFYANASGRKIYVPAASVNAYKSATNWSMYADAIEGYEF